MNIAERNKKVALSRWSKILTKEKEELSNTPQSIQLKSAICGFLAGDGNICKRFYKGRLHCEVRFFPDNQEMIKTYCKFIKLLYKKTPWIKNHQEYSQVRITSKTIVEDLTDITKFGIHDWRLPIKLFEINGAKENWLRAFFSAEAYVGPNVIKVQTVNKEGMLEISNILNELGIQHNFYYYTPKITKQSQVAIITIGTKKARRIFYDKIGFWHSKKTEALKKTLRL